jgi:hypothetical protein
MNVRGTQASADYVKWNHLLDKEDVIDKDKLRLCCAEASRYNVNIHDIMGSYYKKNTQPLRLPVFFLRIGYFEEGEKCSAADQHSNNIAPPILSPEMRSVQRRFATAVWHIIRKYKTTKEVTAVQKWVEWDEVDEDKWDGKLRSGMQQRMQLQ